MSTSLFFLGHVTSVSITIIVSSSTCILDFTFVSQSTHPHSKHHKGNPSCFNVSSCGSSQLSCVSVSFTMYTLFLYPLSRSGVYLIGIVNGCVTFVIWYVDNVASDIFLALLLLVNQFAGLLVELNTPTVCVK